VLAKNFQNVSRWPANMMAAPQLGHDWTSQDLVDRSMPPCSRLNSLGLEQPAHRANAVPMSMCFDEAV
jgi:hypothetical protein